MGASDVLMRVLLKPGDHVVIPHDAYGGTFRLVDKVLALWGVEYTPVDLADIGALRAALRPTTRVVWCETPTNPLLGIADIAAVADVARTAGARLVVDNTFASPYLQQPLALGADVVLHSTTKYVGGHSDVVGGALVTGDDELADAIRFTQNSVGSVPGPFDAWLTLRGVKTLAVRMERHSDNAERIAELLAAHPAVTRVYYPGLAEHPGHEIAAKQMRRFGGMVSFTVAGGRDAALRVCAATEIFTLAESLGGVESLIEHPGAMTHASVAGSALEVPDDLVRLSVGIEDVEDLAEDLRQALSAAAR
jgi:cystathionine gamma-synthase